MIDIAITLDKLVPGAEYGGSLTANTKESYEALRWEDARPKPTWEQIESEWIIVNVELKLQNCKDQAKSLLFKTDWSETQSAQADLQNASEWIEYRKAVRKFIINPVESPVFPSEPEARWKA